MKINPKRSSFSTILYKIATGASEAAHAVSSASEAMSKKMIEAQPNLEKKLSELGNDLYEGAMEIASQPRHYAEHLLNRKITHEEWVNNPDYWVEQILRAQKEADRVEREAEKNKR